MPSSSRKRASAISNKQTPKRRRLENQPTEEAPGITAFTTQRGKRGLKVGEASFKFARIRRADNVLVWKCSRCQCNMETTEALSVIKLPCHKNTCSYGSAKTSLPPVTHFESTATTTTNILPPSTSHSESSPQDVVSFTTQRGKRGIKVDGVSYRLRHVRKSDGIMVWRCSRCYSVLETTAALQIIKMPDHKSTSVVLTRLPPQILLHFPTAFRTDEQKEDSSLV